MRYQENWEAAREEWDRLKSEYPELSVWRLKANDGLKRRVGQCVHKYQLIELAGYGLEGLSKAAVIECVRHETAHALAGPGAKHGPLWQAWARKLGSTARVTARTLDFEEDTRAPVSWVAICPVHGQLNGGWYSQPKMSGRTHKSCGEVVSIVRNRP